MQEEKQKMDEIVQKMLMEKEMQKQKDAPTKSEQKGIEALSTLINFDLNSPTKSDQEVTDALSKLSNFDLNVVIKDLLSIEVAKMHKKQPGPYDWENPEPKRTEGLYYATNARNHLRDMMNESPNSNRNDIIRPLTKYFIKNYYNMDYDEEIQKMEEEKQKMQTQTTYLGGKLYRSKNIKNVNPNDAIKKILEKQEKQEEECNFIN
jgi:hypothetical protein